MDDNNSQDRPSASKNSHSRGGSIKVADSVAPEWTDEKHRLYLNSIEASFVKQLYSSEHGSNDLLGWLSRTQIHSNPSRSDSKSHSSGQFKVLRRGCWEKLNFERAEASAKNGNELQKLSENPWIQHFKTQTCIKDQNLMSAYSMDNNNLVSQSAQFVDWRQGREGTSSKQPFYSHKLHQASADSIQEVSDQNFVDMEVERGEETSRRSGKKRARGAVSPIKDQVVPLMAPTSDEQSAPVKENKDGGSNTNLETIGIEPQSSSFQT